MEHLLIPFLCLAGFLAGFIDSVAGGGGLITLPALLACGVPAQTALGTNKFQSSFGTTFALANFAKKAKVLWKATIVGVPAALLGSVIGARLTLFLPPSTLAKIIIALLPPVAIFIFLSNTFIKDKLHRKPSVFNLYVTIPLIGLAIGFYDGFFGPGTGTFLIIALVLFAHMPLINATATAKTFNLASNVGSLVTFVISGNVLYFFAVPMAIANISGNLIGSHYAIKHGHTFIRKLLIVSLTLLFVFLIWKYFIIHNV